MHWLGNLRTASLHVPQVFQNARLLDLSDRNKSFMTVEIGKGSC